MNESKKSRKSNGSGYTFKVGNSWKTVIEVNGKPVTATNKSKQESRRLAKERAQKASKLNPGSIPNASKVTVGEYLIPWLENEHKNQIAYSTYRRYLGIAKNYIVTALGQIPLQRITKKEVALFLNSLSSNGVKPRTRNQALALLSVAFRSAVEAGLIDINPTNGIQKAAEPAKPIKPLNQAEVSKLLTASAGTFMHARLHIAFAGIRQGEALGLRWKNVDLENGVINIEEQAQKIAGQSTWVKLKTSMSVRPIHLSSSTIDALQRHKAILAQMRLKAGSSWVDNDLVFPNSKGGILQSKVDYARWVKILKSNGISPRRLHDARHTAGTLLYANGEGIETIRRVLGHSSVNLTSKTYVHHAEAPLKSAAETMDKVFKGSDVA